MSRQRPTQTHHGTADDALPPGAVHHGRLPQVGKRPRVPRAARDAGLRGAVHSRQRVHPRGRFSS